MALDDVVHVILVPNYKESLETLCETLDVLASHDRAVLQYKVNTALPTPPSQKKNNNLVLSSFFFFFALVIW